MGVVAPGEKKIPIKLELSASVGFIHKVHSTHLHTFHMEWPVIELEAFSGEKPAAYRLSQIRPRLARQVILGLF